MITDQAIAVMALAAEIILKGVATIEYMKVIDDEVVGLILVANAGVVDEFTNYSIAILSRNSALLASSVDSASQQIQQVFNILVLSVRHLFSLLCPGAAKHRSVQQANQVAKKLDHKPT